MKYRGKPFLYQAVNILQFIFALKSKVFSQSLGTDSLLQPTSSDLEESAEFAFSFFFFDTQSTNNNVRLPQPPTWNIQCHFG